MLNKDLLQLCDPEPFKTALLNDLGDRALNKGRYLACADYTNIITYYEKTSDLINALTNKDLEGSLLFPALLNETDTYKESVLIAQINHGSYLRRVLLEKLNVKGNE